MAKNNEDPQQFPAKDRIEFALLQARRLFLSDTIDNKLAEELIKKLWYLEAEDPKKPILLVINSPGGSVDAGFAIWDQLKMISCPVTTLVTGIAASMGSVIALAASPGRRFATPKSRVMIHQPAIGGVVQGQATDIEIHAREILKMKQHLIDIYVQATGKPPEVIEKSIDRDMWMTAEEGLQFGHFDKIISSYKELE